MYGRFSEVVSPFSEKIKSIAEKGYKAYILTHSDVDGLVSASIISMTLIRLGARCVTRASHLISPESIRELKADPNDFYILCNIGSNMASTLADVADNRWIIINHHTSVQDAAGSLYRSNYLSACKNDIDGQSEISSGGLAYIVSTQIEQSNWDLSPIAVVSALANSQDQGDKKILTGLNSEIMKVAQSHGLLKVQLNLRFTGFETKSIHEALASTLVPFMYGITGNPENAYSIVKNTGVKLKENGRWRVLADLEQEERTIILEAIARFIPKTSRYGCPNLADDLVGYRYTLSCEDLRSPLHDAREFSMLLNACGKTGRPGVGVGVCMGDRKICLVEGERIANQFKKLLCKGVSSILSENWRINLDKSSVFIDGENILDEGMVEDVTSIIFGSLVFGNRAILMRTRSKDGMHKFYCRACLESDPEADLSSIIENCAKSAGGSGGGSHRGEGDCIIPSTGFEDFLASMRRVIIGFNSKNHA